eukprot:42335-Rhodomonas_salina.1
MVAVYATGPYRTTKGALQFASDCCELSAPGMEALSGLFPDRSVWQLRPARVAHVIKAESIVFLSLAATVQADVSPTTDINMIIQSSTLNCT